MWKALSRLCHDTTELYLLWTPSYAGVLENALVDVAAKQAASQSPSINSSEVVSHFRTNLRMALWQYYVGRFDCQWALFDMGCALYFSIPHFSCCLDWTIPFSYADVASISQLLLGHFAIDAYLCHFVFWEDRDCC